MTQLAQPALLELETPYERDNLDLNKFLNEANVSLKLVANPKLVSLLDRHGFTRRGETSWTIGTTQLASLTNFATKYLKEFLPGTLITPRFANEVEADLLRNTSARMPLDRIQGYDNRIGAALASRTIFARPGNAEQRRALQQLQEVTLNLKRVSDMKDYRASRPYGNNRRLDNNTAHNKFMRETNMLTMGVILVSEQNNAYWVRLALVGDVHTQFSSLAPTITLPRMRNTPDVMRSATKTRYFKPGVLLNAFLKQQNKTFTDSLVTENTKQWLTFIDESCKDAVMVGYAPAAPASTKVFLGHRLQSGTKLRRNRDVLNFLGKYKATTRKRSEEGVVAKLSDVLAEKATFEKKFPFYIHPGLNDISAMIESKPFENEKLYDFQREAVGLHLSTSIGYLNACSTGLGKTIMTLVAMQEKARLTKFYRGLIVCEANVRQQWAEEAEEWFPEAEVCVIDSSKDEEKLIDALGSEKPVIVIVSYTQTLLALNYKEKQEAEQEHAKTLTMSQRIKYYSEKPLAMPTIGSLLLETQWMDIAADEAVVIRNANSKQNVALWMLRQNSKVAVALTATPVNKAPEDIANLLAWCRNDRNLFAGEKTLSERYDTSKPKEAKALFDSFGPLVFRRDTSAVDAKLPKVKSNVEKLKPNPGELMLATAAEKELKRVYLELVEALNEIENVKGAKVDAEELAKAKQQLRSANGAWLGGTTLARMATSDPLALLESDSVGASLLVGQGLVEAALKQIPTKRAKFLEDVTSGVAKGEQALVFVSYSSVANLLVKHLNDAGITAKAYTGKNSSTRDKARIEFQEGKIDVLVATQAAERGLTLHKAAAIYHFDLPWTIEKIIQRTGRGVRIGSTNEEVKIVFYVLENTVEERVANHLVKNGVMASLIMDASRKTDVKNTELVTAMSGLMTTMGRTQNGKLAVKFGKEVLGLT